VSWVQTDSSNDVYFTSSNDNGVTFLPNAFDLSPTIGNAVPSPSPAIAAAGTNVYLTWQDDTPGNDDILFQGTGAPSSVPDVAVSSIVLSRNFTYAGVSANITVTITAANPGTVQETFSVTAKTNGTLIGSQIVINLAPGAITVVTFNWNTASLAKGTYVLLLTLPRLPGRRTSPTTI